MRARVLAMVAGLAAVVAAVLVVVHARQAPPRESGEQREVRHSVEQLMEQYWDAMALPTGLRARQHLVENDRAVRRHALAAIWSRAALPARAREVERALRKAADDPGYAAYQDARFVATSWTSVSVDGPEANVTVEGHPEFLLESGWRPGATSRFVLELTRQEPGVDGWRLVDEREEVLSGAG